ncbi:GNAT family N-acetyltransferase [Ancylobacter dichloromethanicus]|uniref:N-acetyltransferase n=1 Tax=Ancylobacter dichloromethanicus TaxID=518825 RepID=A0A9W6J7K3_9HYPH|nr:GNAT family N-acetyltransferase [Ancylobacter dichloromethanicus]MBS7553740.1 GNAT family N-acetyltransferase [Ancylobacter dichloromethanicus]GLK70844.1 N-acetyltransferase [Ancylobacter dichloromethanicus]
MSAADIRPLAPDPATIDALAALLVETVAAGGSVGFMHPLAAGRARDFARATLEAATRGERLVLGAFVGGELASTVTLQLALPENQPHRAEIAKMMTHPAFRGRSLARALLEEAERLARMRGRTLLVLDTAEEDGAAGLYEKHGFIRAGALPDYALKPRGGLTATLLYFKRLGTEGG